MDREGFGEPRFGEPRSGATVGREPDRHEPRLVRPYALTGGRARNRWTDLRIEALLTATPTPSARAALNPEQRTITRLCRQRFQSVAEISALMELPLGVVRVLVGDMVEQGTLELYQPEHSDRPDLALLERVLYGLRRI